MVQIVLKSGEVWFLMCFQSLHSKPIVVMVRAIPYSISSKESLLGAETSTLLTDFAMREFLSELLVFKYQTLPFADVLVPFSTWSMLNNGSGFATTYCSTYHSGRYNNIRRQQGKKRKSFLVNLSCSCKSHCSTTHTSGGLILQRWSLQGMLTLLAPISCFAHCMSLSILMKKSLSQALDTLIHLFDDKEILSSDWISVSCKKNLFRLAGEYFNCLCIGRQRGQDLESEVPLFSSENWAVGCLWAVGLAMCALRPSSFAVQPASDSCLRHHPGHACSHPPSTHSSLLCPQARPAGLSTDSTGKQVGACVAQTCFFKPG